jgi:Tfp pilus assembly protein PilN
MTGEPSHEQREHELTLHLFSISAAMVGVCLTAIGILRLVTAQTKVQTLGDDFLAVDAVLFVVCCFLSFWSFKTKQARLRQRLRLLVDVLFMAALVVMTGICAIIAYAIV